MELLRVVYRQYRWPFLAVMALTMASAGLGIGIIAFINQYLMDASGNPLAVLPMFLALLALLIAVTLGSTAGADHIGPLLRLSIAWATGEAHSGYRDRAPRTVRQRLIAGQSVQ